MTDFNPDQLTDHIDLWVCDPAQVTDPAQLETYAALLNDEERARWQRFRLERDRNSFLVTRALIRTTLSHYAPLAPEEWQFTHTRWGKPEIVQEQNDADLRPNLAHTNRMICCAITRSADLGVDVEFTLRRSATLRVARRYFAAAEIEQLEELPDRERRERFFDFWTLKEAYIKARGIGVAAGLGNFAFTVHKDAAVTLEFARGFDDGASLWNFALLQLRESHLSALAIRGANRLVSPTTTLRQGVPNGAWAEVDCPYRIPFRTR